MKTKQLVRSLCLSPSEAAAALRGELTEVQRVIDLPEWFLEEYDTFGAAEIQREIPCPLGPPGTRILGKETFTLLAVPKAMEGATQLRRGPEITKGHFSGGLWQYAAWYDGDPNAGGWPERLRRVSAVHMPPWAARHTFRLASIRCERGREGEWSWVFELEREKA